MRQTLKTFRRPNTQVAVSLGSGSVLLVGCTGRIEEWTGEESNNQTAQEHSQRTQGLVQMRVIDLNEDVDTQETSCYVYEGTESVKFLFFSTMLNIVTNTQQS
ncbi:uncharacterized protein LOC143146586 [Ptiloglossa arizonensis]|uniref:uncharacterized protein LOC143146586 n=1 Tax=Ptiloglossa arizonensis TaxID=3350558 RepID=UPI003F9F2B36